MIHSKDGTTTEGRKAAGALCSAFKAEAVSLYSALARFTPNIKEGQHIDIFTDCQTQITKIKKGPHGQDIRPLDEACKFLKQITVCISWIPGHYDIEGNENADTLAREARYKQAPSSCSSAWCLYHQNNQVKVREELNKSWRDSVDHSQWNIRRSAKGEFTRQERTTLAQIRTGHCALLKAYRKRIELEDDGTCETCKIEEDREHFPGKCPAWSQERRETFGKTFLSHRELIEADPADIVAFLRRIGRLPANDSA